MSVAFALTRLSFRRCLPAPLFLIAVLMLVLGILPGAHMPDALAQDSDALGRMLARARLWMISALTVTLICVPRAAGAAAAARGERGDLLAASPLPRWVEVCSTWAGIVAAGSVLLILGAAAAEAAAGKSQAALSPLVEFSNPALRLVEDNEASWVLPLDRDQLKQCLGTGARLVLRPVILPMEGRSTDFSARVDGAGIRGEEVQALLSGRSALSLPLGQALLAPLTLVVSRSDQGAVAVVPEHSLELFVPAPLGERSAGVRLLVVSCATLMAACALAIGLGTWMQAWIAVLGVFSIALFCSMIGFPGSSFGSHPGAGIAALLRGNVPSSISPAQLAGLVFATLAGLGLACTARGRRRLS